MIDEATHMEITKITTEPFIPPTPPEGVELVTAPVFDDRWCCNMCRTVERICDFHQSMEDDGYKPPKSFSGLL